jgi:hypothetical protein
VITALVNQKVTLFQQFLTGAMLGGNRKQLPTRKMSKSNLQVIALAVGGVAGLVLGLYEILRRSCAQDDPAAGLVEDHSSFFLPAPSHDAHLPLCGK